MNEAENNSLNNRGRALAVQSSAGNAVAVYDENFNRTIDEDEIDLRALWRVIFRYRKLIATIFSVVMLTALMLTLLMRPMFTSTVSLEINTSGRNLVKFQNLESQDLGNREYIGTQTKILGSAAIANEVIDRLGLTEEPELTGALTQRGLMNGIRSILNLFRTKNKSEHRISQGVEKRYLDRLTVSALRNTSLVNVSFTSFSPALAADAANEHALAYVALSNERRFNSTSGAKLFLEKEIANVQAKLETSEKQLNDFARKHGVVDMEDRNNIMMSRLSKLNDSLSEVQSERIDAETRNLQAKTANFSALTVVNDDLLIETLREEQAKLRSEYFELSKIYKPKYPAMEQLKAKIDEIESNIRAQTSKIVGGIESNFQQLVLREAKLNQELEVLKQELLNLQDRAVTYNILKREWEANKELYTGLLERTKEVGVAAGMELNVASIIDKAAIPTRASSPKLGLNLLLAGLLGAIVGLAAAFLLAMLDNTINDVEQLDQVTQIGHLGVSPLIDIDVEELDETSRIKVFDTAVHSQPSSGFAESIQSVRTSLSYARAGGFPKSIMVTSSMASEGKSTVAMNLAISCAKAGKNVIVVEADLRRSRHYKVFGVPSSPGLSDYLVGSKPAAPYTVKQIANLSVLVGGTKTPNPVDLLGSQQMIDLISLYEERYDLVVVDCPPVLGLADSIVMSRIVESVLFVVSAHQTPQDAVKNSIQRLRMVNAPLIGTVLNKVQSKNAGYSYDYSNYEYGLDEKRELAES